MAKAKEDILTISNSSATPQLAQLSCPYDQCGKSFEKPVVLTDFSKTPRETYYACPYCFSKLEIALEAQENLHAVSVKTSREPEMVLTPKTCEHHMGYLAALAKEDAIPDECLTCTKLMQCMVRK
jgi:DNA-directed RNA polymerase subunit RPC12/RpoP